MVNAVSGYTFRHVLTVTWYRSSRRNDGWHDREAAGWCPSAWRMPGRGSASTGAAIEAI
jgi:hypothetical protein